MKKIKLFIIFFLLIFLYSYKIDNSFAQTSTPASCNPCHHYSCYNGKCAIHACPNPTHRCADTCSSDKQCAAPTNPPPTNPPPTSPPAGTPTPFIQVKIFNPKITPVKVSQLCKASCTTAGVCTQSSCSSNVSTKSFPKGTGSDQKGGKISLTDSNGQTIYVVGVTPSPQGNYYASCPSVGGACYVWDTWNTGKHQASFIVDTTPPAGSPTPTGALSPSPTINLTPSPTVNPSCNCKADNSCDASCSFDKYPDVTYNNPIECSREASITGPTPDATGKTAYCQRYERTKGDVDGDGTVTNSDYYYYVSAVNGGGIPALADPDVNGDGLVSPDDRAIIVRTMGGTQ